MAGREGRRLRPKVEFRGLKKLMPDNAGSDFPIYCKECKKSNTWVRDPERDIKSESGKTMWWRWKCAGGCGQTTIYPVKENL